MINRQSSFTALPNKKAKQLHSLTQQKGINTTKSAGGTIGNTLQNLAVLSCSSPVQFGMISKIIPTGSPASDFIQNNHHLMNLDYLSAIDGQVGCAYVLISEDGDRTFGINPGMTDQLPAEGVSEAIIKQANCLAISAFTLSNEGSPIFKATLKATELANKHRTPVVMSLASENLVQSAKCFLNAYLYDHVTVAAMNSAEARALTGSQYTLNACLKVLDQVDISLITDDKNGMYLCGYIDNPDISEQREHATGEDFSSLLNKYSDQYPMLHSHCLSPCKTICYEPSHLSHQDKLVNTNGAGDSALAALLHGITGKIAHTETVKTESKYTLSYKTFAENSYYSSEVSRLILQQEPPRLAYAPLQFESDMKSYHLSLCLKAT